MVQMLSQEHFENTVICVISESDYILHFPLMMTNVRGDSTCRDLIPPLVFCVHDCLWEGHFISL